MEDKYQKWIVWSLDVWGHGHDECCLAYDCPCVHLDGAGVQVHDDEHHECDAEFTVNDRCRVGTVELREGVESSEIERILIKENFLNAAAEGHMEINDEDDIYVNVAKNGRPIFQLERERA